MPDTVADLTSKLRTLWERLNSDPTAPRAKRTSPNWLALLWEPQGVTVVDALLESDVVVRHVSTVEWSAGGDPESSPPQAGQQLAGHLASLSLSTTQVVVVIPREVAIVRRLDLPAVPDDELPDLVRFQAAARTSTPVERLVLDYVPLATAGEGSRTVLLATIDAVRLRTIQATLDAAKLELVSVGFSPVATAEIALRQGIDPQSASPSAVIWHSGSLVELSLIDRGRLAFSHSLRLPSGDAQGPSQPVDAELNRALAAMTQAHLEGPVEQAYLIAGEDSRPIVRDRLEQRFAGRLNLLDPLAGVNAAALSGPERQLARAAAPAIGQLLTRLQSTLPPIDFLNPRKRYTPPDRRKEKARLALGGVALLGLIGFWWRMSAISDRNERIEALKTAIKTLDQEISEAKPVVDSADEISAWKASDPKVLVSLSQLSQRLPGTDQLYFKSLKILPPPPKGAEQGIDATLSGTCLAISEDAVHAFEDGLAKSKRYQVHASNPTTEKKIDPDYPWQYVLKADQLNPRDATGAKSQP